MPISILYSSLVSDSALLFFFLAYNTPHPVLKYPNRPFRACLPSSMSCAQHQVSTPPLSSSHTNTRAHKQISVPIHKFCVSCVFACVMSTVKPRQRHHHRYNHRTVINIIKRKTNGTHFRLRCYLIKINHKYPYKTSNNNNNNDNNN